MMQSKLSLSVSEQPSRLHRFRYASEIKENRMGSVLHGVSSSKTPVKVRVTRSGPLSSDCHLRFVGCTVFEDQATHPFFLNGDDCKDGAFQKELSIPAGCAECEVTLDRIGVVCTLKKRRAVRKDENSKDTVAKETAPAAKEAANYQSKITQWNFFNKTPRSNPFKDKDVNKLRLAFQVFVQAPDSKDWTVAPECEPVATEVISDAKIFSELTVDCVIPKSVSRRDKDIWLYMKDPLPAESARRFKVTMQDRNQEFDFPDLKVKSLKKHLVVFDLSELMFLTGDKTVDVSVTDVETGDASNSVELQLRFPSDDLEEPVAKRRRSALEPRLGDDMMQKLMKVDI